MNQGLLIAAADKLLVALEVYYESGEYVKPFRSQELADCVLYHAAAAGAAAMAAGLLPGAGSVIAVAICAGAVWRMYIKICQIIGAAFGKNKLKTISSAVLTNVITQLAGIYAISIASSLIPVAGSVVVGIGNFVVTYFAGLIFLNVLTGLFKVKRTDVENLSAEEWSEAIRSTISNIDKKAVLKEAKNLFMEMKKDGSLDKAGQTVDISMEEDI